MAVSNEVILERLENVSGLLERHFEASDKIHGDHEERLRSLETKTVVIQQRQGILAAAQGVFSVVASSVAGFLSR
jgi:hypothetical protein